MSQSTKQKYTLEQQGPTDVSKLTHQPHLHHQPQLPFLLPHLSYQTLPETTPN